MNPVTIIFEYDKIVSQLSETIKNSHYKVQFFLDLLNLKRGFFYKKLKEKRFTSDEMKLLSKHLFPDDYTEYEVEVIDKLLDYSSQQIKDGLYKTHEMVMEEIREKHGL
jgi:hypothetical protein